MVTDLMTSQTHQCVEPHAIVSVAVPAPLRGCFDYLCPATAPQVGARVLVPFGRRKLVGVVNAVVTHTDVPQKSLRALTEVIDDAPIVDESMRELLRWMANYYHHPIGEVFAAALPVRLRKGEAAERKLRKTWQLSDAGKACTPEYFKGAPRQQQMWQMLKQHERGISIDDLREMPGYSAAVLKRLESAGFAEKSEIAQAPQPTAAEHARAPELNQEQAVAVTQMSAHTGFKCSLLEGVTGSGKTEVYLALIEQVLAAGKQVLVLVPEIGLTPQLIQRFEQRLSSGLAVLHSGLNDSERLDAWLMARVGEAGVILGTRSAVLTPLAQPGLIIVDEEHDASYKQQDGLRYSARDVAVRRAQIHDIPIVLGSATPALESLHNALTGRYQHLRLHSRAGGAQKPRMRLLDVRALALTEGLSPVLIQSVQKHLDSGGQALLFLNRRGYAPALVCHDCGWIAPCQRCDTGMTLHRGGRHLCCHHCGAQQPPPRACENCGGQELVAVGEGTERIAAALRGLFPGVPMARFDRDTLTQKGSMEKRLQEVRDGKIRLLVGTQMLAKGHDFPDLSFVGVVNSDHGLFSADFRALERMAQLVTQVAGRAGRGQRPGEVVLQTRHPDHPLLGLLISQGYHAFAQAALAERQSAGLPPHGYLALLQAESPQPGFPPAFLDAAAQAAYDLNMPDVELWGPVPAPMERRAGRTRGHLLVRAPSRALLHKLLHGWIPVLEKLPLARRVRWAIDVDPQDLI